MSFKLHIKTLAGNEYVLSVTPGQSIAILKSRLLNKLIHDPSYSVSLDSETTTLRLQHATNNGFVELMDDKKISDYPLTSNSDVALMIEAGNARFHVNVIAPHGMFAITIKPMDTINDVKHKIYEAMVEEPFYEDKSSNGGVFNLRIQQNGASIKLQPLRTVDSYPGIYSNSTMELIMDDEELFVQICKNVSEYEIHCYGSMMYNYLESVEEFKQRIVDKFDVPSNDFQLAIERGRKGKIVLEEGTHLYDYDMSEVSKLWTIFPENNNQSNGGKRNASNRRKTRKTRSTRKKTSKRRTNK